MSKIFITGSTTGLGFLAGKKLLEDGNEVYLHARNQDKAAKLKQKLPNVRGIIIGDLSQRQDVNSIVRQVNSLGKFDVIIHNAGVYTSDSKLTFNVNVLAPFLLTQLIQKPKRLIYVASGMHIGARLPLEDLENKIDYSGSKLAIMLLMKKFSREYPSIVINAVDPGWVPTRMGGSGANDSLEEGYLSQVYLSESNQGLAIQSGNCLYHRKIEKADTRVTDYQLQDELFAVLDKYLQ